jgi:hypothetical protein
MRTRQPETPAPNHAPTIHTPRPKPHLRIAIAVAALAITLAACGSTNTARRGTDPHATPAAHIERHTTNEPYTVRLPNLRDPATRKQFVCNFANGYFTQPQPPRYSTSNYCR